MGRFDACQSLFETLELERESFVVHTEQIQDRGVKVPDVQRVFHDIIGEVVGFSVDRSAFRTTTGHPHAEASGMMVTPVVFF